MYELIKAKMDKHVQAILDKDTITNEDYRILADALSHTERPRDNSASWMFPLILSLVNGGVFGGV